MCRYLLHYTSLEYDYQLFFSPDYWHDTTAVRSEHCSHPAKDHVFLMEYFSKTNLDDRVLRMKHSGKLQSEIQVTWFFDNYGNSFNCKSRLLASIRIESLKYRWFHFILHVNKVCDTFLRKMFLAEWTTTSRYMSEW